MPFEPPIGVTLVSDEAVPLDELIHIGRRILSFLQSQNIAPTRLRRYDDWLEHDGLHFAGLEIKFSDVFRLFESPRSLFEATPGEEAVCIGIGPESNDWYLRTRGHWNSEDSGLVGMISITMQPQFASRFREEVLAHGPLALSEEESVAYFSRITV